ncbi:MAG: branched-chain amino acid ABC transporter permease [Candidatus Caldarchaeales archaeon]|jgi:branched-chain amino acid transport system permease protein|nr:branched-chain amino acid ABC transporter permease [Candidatus Caldarchaeales archaeon]
MVAGIRNDNQLKTLIIIMPIILFILPIILPLPPSWVWVMIFANYYTVVAMSWNIVLGYGGQFSFAQHGLLAVGGYSSAFLVNILRIHPIGSIFLGGTVAAIIGLGIGAASLRLRGIYFALTTFGFSYIVYLFTQSEYKLTGGKAGLKTEYLLLKSPFFSLHEYYVASLLLMLFAMLVSYIFTRSRYGMFLKAIREDEEAAAVYGVNIIKIKLFAFTYSSFLAGLMGGFYAHIIGYISPAMADLSTMGTIIVISVLGGLGTFLGPFIGAYLIWPFSELIRSYSAALSQIIFSVAVILALKFMPNGLVGFFGRIIGSQNSAIMRETFTIKDQILSRHQFHEPSCKFVELRRHHKPHHQLI